ncbi:MAG: 7-cyano-7-deazaguanine synthase [Thermodesulfovibrionales bacterium]|nr:7-cyano-7-deazaguanine synthase [Thermodesulfovibrionales bacterium]
MRSEKGAKYECVATLSGGRDSTYVLYSAVKILGLNILSVSYDNGFRHVQSMKNARNACEVLGVDLLEFRSRDDLNARITAHALHVSIPFGPGAACKLMCRLCYNGGLAFVCSVAEKYEIPFVLWGDSLIKKISFIPVRDTFLKFRSPLRYLLSKRGPSFVRFLRLLIEQRNESLPSETSGLM